jgi:hypothetical protein
MATARLKMRYFDPVVSQKKPQFPWPWHRASKICKERTGIWFAHTHYSNRFKLNCPKD